MLKSSNEILSCVLYCLLFPSFRECILFSSIQVFSFQSFRLQHLSTRKGFHSVLMRREFTNSNSGDFPPPVKLGEDRRSDHIKTHHTSLKEKTQKSRHKWIQSKHVNHNHGNKLVLYVLYYLLYFLFNVCTSSMFSLWEHWLLVIFSSRRASLVGNVAISIYWPMLSNDQ